MLPLLLGEKAGMRASYKLIMIGRRCIAAEPNPPIQNIRFIAKAAGRLGAWID